MNNGRVQPRGEGVAAGMKRYYSGLEYMEGLSVRINLVVGFTPFSLTANDTLLAVAIVANRHKLTVDHPALSPVHVTRRAMNT